MDRIAILFTLFSSLTATVVAGEPDFVRDIRPIFEKHCYQCHGAEKQKSGLRLDVKSAAFKGGEIYGPSIVAGKVSDSPLIEFVSDRDSDLPMPPQGPGLSRKEIDLLTQWVEAGAKWPDGVDLFEVEDLTDHWSFHPVSRPDLPSPRNAGWAKQDLDYFILAKLESQGLKPAQAANRATWIRRVYLDLTGLPPTMEQVTRFVNDAGPDAYQRVVDQLLASPRYGERWAQHWLDVVRYADTHGFEVNTERPHAWPYRDYVIRALNQDLPYDQFVKQQVAGDLTGHDSATGFLVTASVLLPGQVGKDAPSIRLARQDAIDEIVVNIGQTFLGVSLGCARCHDHKFDPVSQREYYAMQAFVAGVEYGDREIVTPEIAQLRQQAKLFAHRVKQIEGRLTRFAPIAGSGARRPPVNPRRNTDRFQAVQAKQLRFTVRSTNRLEPCIDELEVFNDQRKNVALASLGAKVESSGDNVSPNRHELRFINDGEYGNSRSWMSDETGQGWVVITFAEVQNVDCVAWGRDRQGKFGDRLATDYLIEVAGMDGQWRTVADASDRQPGESKASGRYGFDLDSLKPDQAKEAQALLTELAALEQKIQRANEGQKIFAGIFRQPDSIRMLTRGDPEMPKDEVGPAVPAALGEVSLPTNAEEQHRRKVLADWIADETNPLTARVMVNRIWQGHFGTGLVQTPNDLGHAGEFPSHPQLLDWLADEFVQSGWSIKQLHRQIVLSATYRQASWNNDDAVSSRATSIDSDARLLWRFPSRRMDAETIRDSMLFASGRLNLTMYGRGFDLFDKRGGLTGFRPVESFSGEGLRRMIYAHKVRRERDGVFGAFDCPDAGQSTPRRRESTTPVQALNLFNSQFTLDQSAALADRVVSETADQISQQVTRSYQIVLSRSPSEMELREAEQFVRQHGLKMFCRVLFNTNEFLFHP